MDDMETYKNNRNSIKIDIEAARLAAETIDNKLPKETYRKIIDDFGPVEGEYCKNRKVLFSNSGKFN